MSLYITNSEADRLARELASRTGETLTEAVVTALRERLARIGEMTREERITRALDIAHHAASILGDRSPEIDDLYDAKGLPA